MRIRIHFVIAIGLLSCTSCSRNTYQNRHRAHGTASYYSQKYEGKNTASGEVFRNKGYTAASNKFRMGAYVKVINKRNGQYVYVKVNDRMGNTKRLIDLTLAATQQLGFQQAGTTPVTVKVVRAGKAKRRIRRQG